MKRISHYITIFILIFSLFSCDEDFVSRDFPSVLTRSVTMDKDGSIVFSGELISRDSEAVDEVGFVWQSSGEPDIETGFKANLSGKIKTGVFQLKVFTSIKKNAEYYVRAYALTNGKIIYGDTWIFVSQEDFLPPAFILKTKSGQVGDTIEIIGGLFNKTVSKNSVSVNSLDAEVVEVKDSSILCVVPWSLTVKESTVTVTCEGIASEISEKFQLVTPTITLFSPTIVPFLDTITIFGTGFHRTTAINVVRFGSTQGTVLSSTPGSLIVRVPFTTDTLCYVTVAVSGQSATSQNKIKIIAPNFDYFSPTSARHLDTIAILCKNIDPNLITAVYFDSFHSRIIGTFDNEVRIEVPGQLDKESSNLKILFPGGEYIFSYPFVLLQPLITSVSDDKANNFSTITIYGQNYNPILENNKLIFKNTSYGNLYTLTPFFSSYDSLKVEIKNHQIPGKALPSARYQIGIQTCENIVWSDYFIDITDMWRELGDFPGGERYKGAGFTINGKGYAGMGTKLHNDLQNDLWEFNPINETWTRKADMPGGERILPVTFANSNAGFIGGGQDYDNSSVQKPYLDFYKYTPSTNSWTKLINLPAMQKSFIPTSGSIGENSHFAILTQGTMYKYDNSINSWSQVYNGDGTSNIAPCYFTINGKIYFISGSQTATNGTNSQVWEYDPLTSIMTRKSDFPGLSRYGAFSFAIGNYGYVGGGVHYITNEPSPQCLYDVYRYDPGSDRWTFISIFPGGYNKMYCYSFVIGTKAYLIGGLDYCKTILHSDVWEFTDGVTSFGSR